MLRARSVAEARLYMDLQPCAGCGRRGFEAASELAERGDALVSIYRGPCPECGAQRSFEFDLPDGYRVSGFGGPEPSTLIDPGEFLTVADERIGWIPGDPARLAAGDRDRARRDLATAIAAVDEVLKFIPDGAHYVPARAFFTARGKRMFLADAPRFDRRRLLAVRDAYLELARAVAGG